MPYKGLKMALKILTYWGRQVDIDHKVPAVSVPNLIFLL
jgi:hypothetical protein